MHCFCICIYFLVIFWADPYLILGIKSWQFLCECPWIFSSSNLTIQHNSSNLYQSQLPGTTEKKLEFNKQIQIQSVSCNQNNIHLVSSVFSFGFSSKCKWNEWKHSFHWTLIEITQCLLLLVPSPGLIGILLSSGLWPDPQSRNTARSN